MTLWCALNVISTVHLKVKMPNKRGGSSTAPSFVQQTIRQLGQDRSASPQKRRRQQDGEPTGALEQIKELIETQMSEFAKLKEEFQCIADTMKSELNSLKLRVSDLEEHTNRKDEELEDMGRRLTVSEETVFALQKQLEKNEVLSRLPTLIFSGPAVEKSESLPRSARSAGDGLTGLTLTGPTSSAASAAGGAGTASGPEPEPGTETDPEPGAEPRPGVAPGAADQQQQQRPSMSQMTCCISSARLRNGSCWRC